MNKAQQLRLLGNIQETPPALYNDHVLIIDGLNTFIRSFTLVKSITPDGHHVGGLLGFMRSLGYVTRTIQPTRVIVVFDGKGSSQSRKNVDSNYKAQREGVRVTNWEMFDNKEQEYASMGDQLDRLYDYLECLPVQHLTVDKVEADDVIAYIANEADKKGNKATIVSSDKDFLQIVTKNVNVYSPIKKKFYDPSMVKAEVGMLPENYLVAKSLLGDNSDNLSGVRGLGVKTLLKEFNYLVERPGVTLEDIYETCERKIDGKKIFASILQYKHRVDTNYELMNLQEPTLTDYQVEEIDSVVFNKPNPLNVMAFLYLLEQDKVPGITKNTEGWLEVYRPLANFSVK